ncbi:MAG: sugar ABC transporter ATP-binding protein [Candidatus Binatia bacterium]|nr:MAG: sugar ABC transporter ATP-binding protein [Candidatus Binatia bacterium]
MARVALQNVSKIFPGGAVALEDVNLEIADGELLVVVGPSGCGKSTLLRVIAGLEEVTRGEVWIGSELVNHVPPQKRNVAMVFQDYALYPFLTVEENLAFPLRMRKLSRAEQRSKVERVARLLEIEPLLRRYPGELSGGQRQRVAMGRALVREPSVSLFDEPLSNLDAKLRVSVRAEIAAIQERTRTTMIYVTHDQTEAMTLGHRVAVLDRGRVQQVAPPRVLYEHPANAFVAGFIGNPPMNLFPAKLHAAGSQLFVQLEGLELAIDPACIEHAPVSPGQSVIAGVRPEAIECRGSQEQGWEEAEVEHVEQLGHETLLYLRLVQARHVRWVARLAGMQPYKKGDRVFVRVPAGRWYVFPPSPAESPAPQLGRERSQACSTVQ